MENTQQNNFNTVPAPINDLHHEHPKKLMLIIILETILLIIFIALYFLGQKPEPKKIYTDEEKAKQIEEVYKMTQEQGLPSTDKQLEIMRYNREN